MGIFHRTSEDLREAARDGRPYDIRKYINRGISPFEADPLGNNALHYVALSTSRDNVEALDELLKEEMDIDCRNQAGETPLFRCVAIEMVKAFVQRGADVNATSMSGRTVLFKYMETNDICLFPLLDSSSKLNVNKRHGSTGETPLHYLCRNGELTSRLMAKLVALGVDPTLANKAGKLPHEVAKDPKAARVMIEQAMANAPKKPLPRKPAAVDHHTPKDVGSSSSLSQAVMIERAEAVRRDLYQMCKVPMDLEGCPVWVLDKLVEEIDQARNAIVSARTVAVVREQSQRLTLTPEVHRVQCVICCSRLPDVKFNCGHVVTCQQCARSLPADPVKRCPTCRRAITEMERVYL